MSEDSIPKNVCEADLDFGKLFKLVIWQLMVHGKLCIVRGAVPCLASRLELFPGDMATQRLMGYMDDLKKSDLPGDWDGSIDLKEK